MSVLVPTRRTIVAISAAAPRSRRARRSGFAPGLPVWVRASGVAKKGSRTMAAGPTPGYSCARVSRRATDSSSAPAAIKERGHIGLFQTKFEFPTAKNSMRIPLSLTVSNRSELIKESDVTVLLVGRERNGWPRRALRPWHDDFGEQEESLRVRVLSWLMIPVASIIAAVGLDMPEVSAP